MNVYDWNLLDDDERAEALERPAQQIATKVTLGVADIIDQVRRRGGEAVREFARRYDGSAREQLLLTSSERAGLNAQVAPELRAAMNDAALRIEAFHARGGRTPYRVETAPGVFCERIVRPVRSVGLYVPAGTAPLPSTALMLGIPARIAGCPTIVVCTPPGENGLPDPAVVAACEIAGIDQIAVVGGAQAIAAMAFGIDEIPRADKIFGPGNAWVTEAKRQVSTIQGGPGIDMPAGPSEQLVIADATANARFVAADLLSQAEHGVDSQVILVSPDDDLLLQVADELDAQCAALPRAQIASAALAKSRLIKVRDLEQACAVSNVYAPEHLIIATREPRSVLPGIEAAGSVFLGTWAPESLGDYCSGTNHVLPTSGAARFTGGVSVASFQLPITVQEVTQEGLAGLGPTAVTIARAEGLEAHARAVTVRVGDEPA